MSPITEQERSKPFQSAVNSPRVDLAGASAPPKKKGRLGPARVLIVEANQDGTVGGSYQVLFDLAVRIDRAQFEPIALFYQDNAFVGRLRDRGIEVVLFDKVASMERETIQSGRLTAKLLGLGTAVLRRQRELRRLRIDLLHLNNSPGVGNDDWLPASRLAGIPCVVSAAGEVGRPRRLIHRWLYRRFDLYLAVSRHIATSLRTQGVNPNRIELVYPGVDFEALHRQRVRSSESVRSELGVAPDQLLVLMVGNIRAWKGQREVIAALRLLPKNILARIRVCFAGATSSTDSAYEEELRAEVTAGGLADCVSFLGFRSDGPDLYGAADIAVHASTTPEPFGLVVPEAMALKCAVIAASLGGPAEVITPGTGFLRDPSKPEEYARALEQLVRDDSLRRAIGDAGPARAALFSIERTVETMERVYHRALEQSHRRRAIRALSPRARP